MIVNQKTRSFLAPDFAIGIQRDFQWFKESRVVLASHIRSLADSGYMGLGKLHANSQIPAKKLKLHPLTSVQKESNRQLSQERILVEKVICRLKGLPHLIRTLPKSAETFFATLHLIAAIYNL